MVEGEDKVLPVLKFKTTHASPKITVINKKLHSICNQEQEANTTAALATALAPGWFAAAAHCVHDITVQSPEDWFLWQMPWARTTTYDGRLRLVVL